MNAGSFLRNLETVGGGETESREAKGDSDHGK